MCQLVIASRLWCLQARLHANLSWLRLREVLQTQESKAACEEYHRLVKSQIKGKTAEKIRSVVLARADTLWKIHFCVRYTLCLGSRSRNLRRRCYGSMACRNGLAFTDAGLIENPDDPGFPVGIPQVKAKNPITELPPEDPQDYQPVVPCAIFENQTTGVTLRVWEQDIYLGKLASVSTHFGYSTKNEKTKRYGIRKFSSTFRPWNAQLKNLEHRVSCSQICLNFLLGFQLPSSSEKPPHYPM